MKTTKLTRDALMRSSTRVFLSFVLCIVLHAPLLVNAAATKAKCTCYLESESEKKNGAEVTNASACFLSVDKNDKWCAFDVDSLKSTKRHAKTVEQLRTEFKESSSDSLVNVFVSRFREWSSDGTNEHFRMISEQNFSSGEDFLEEIRNRLDFQATLLLSCVKDFNSGEVNENEELEGDDPFQCGVHSNGWLTVALNFDHFVVFYLLGPL